MATNSPGPVYRKLTGLHRGVGTMTQLYLGPDHLLHVQSTGYSENYRRFYLRDIQSLLIVHTASRTYIGATLAFFLLLALLIVAGASGGKLSGYLVVAGCFLPLLVWNHLLGPGCRVVVVTAVQQENIRALSRLPKTHRILADLRPRIEAAQAELGVASLEPAPPLMTNDAPPPPPPLPPPLPAP